MQSWQATLLCQLGLAHIQATHSVPTEICAATDSMQLPEKLMARTPQVVKIGTCPAGICGASNTAWRYWKMPLLQQPLERRA